MEFEQYSYRLAGHWASPIVNGDATGLSDAEESELNTFLGTLPKGCGHWDGWNEETSNFGIDEVSGKYAETFECTYFVPKV